MAVVNGTAGKNFIHRAGDGLVPPGGFSNITGVTTGNDTINALGGDDIVYGDAGNDTINGGDGNDRLNGGNGNDKLNGGNGNDVLDGGLGNDAMTGGGGNDTYIVNAAGDTVTEAAAGGTDTVRAAISYTLGANLEKLVLTGSGDTDGTGNSLANTITGNSGDNILNGAGGNDTLNGGDGDDILIGGSGNDRLIGGTGFDIMLGGTGNDTIQINLSGGDTDAAVAGGNAGDKLVLTGNASFGSVTVDLAQADQLTSDGQIQSGFNNIDASALFGLVGTGSLTGNDNNNSIIGTSSSEFIHGGAGNDMLSGGGGNDTLQIAAEDDVVAGETYDGGDGTFDSLSIGFNVTAINLSSVTLANLEQLSSIGSAKVTLTANQLDGFTGINVTTITLSGAGNADISDASISTDVFNLSNAGNGLTLLGSTFNNVIVNGGSGAGTVTVLDPTFGTSASSTLTGKGGNDTLNGSSGADFITGGAGNDTLTGGGGADWFIYTGANGTDIITDFNGTTAFGGGAGEGDKLTFEDVLQGEFEYRGANDFLIDGNTQARVSGGQVLMDTDGDGGSDLAITMTGLTNASQLVAGDFQFT